MKFLEMKVKTALLCGVFIGVALFMLEPLWTVGYLRGTTTLALVAFVICAVVVQNVPRMETLLLLALFTGVTHIFIGMVSGDVFAPQFKYLSAIALYFGPAMLFVTLWEWAKYLFPQHFAQADVQEAEKVQHREP